MTTLEEVFLRLAHAETNGAEGGSAPPNNTGVARPINDDEGGDDDDVALITVGDEQLVPPSGAARWWKQVSALMVVRAKSSYRSGQALFFQIVIPCVLLVLALTVVLKPPSQASPFDNEVALVLEPSPSTSVPFVYHGGGPVTSVAKSIHGLNVSLGGMLKDVSRPNLPSISAYFRGEISTSSG